MPNHKTETIAAINKRLERIEDRLDLYNLELSQLRATIITLHHHIVNLEAVTQIYIPEPEGDLK